MLPAGLRVRLKTSAASGLRLTGVTAAGRLRRRRAVTILTYHGVLAAGQRHHEYLSRNCVDQDVFQAQMRYLARHYACLSLSDAVTRLQGRGPLPRNPVAVTFDDGFRNNYTHAFPVLQETGVPATIFVATGHVGQGCRMLWTERVGWLLDQAPAELTGIPIGDRVVEIDLTSPEHRVASTRRVLAALKAAPADLRAAALDRLEAETARTGEHTPDADRYAFMDWHDARRMTDTGLVEIGSHTVSHLLLATGTRQQRRDELRTSKEAIERALDRPCTSFAYPNGTARDFDAEDKRVLHELGYACAASQIPGANDRTTDRYELRRYNVGRGHSLPVFTALLAGLWPAGRV